MKWQDAPTFRRRRKIRKGNKHNQERLNSKGREKEDWLKILVFISLQENMM
jgi:hypothetical protein